MITLLDSSMKYYAYKYGGPQADEGEEEEEEEGKKEGDIKFDLDCETSMRRYY